MKKTALLLLVVAAPAMAQQPPTAEDLTRDFFQYYDSNQDGYVSVAEYTAPSAAQFSMIDGNADGIIDGGDVDAFVRMMLERARKPQQ